MSRTLEIDMSEFRDFFSKLEKAGENDFKQELQTFLDGLGMEFLRICEEEIIRRKVMDTRLLLHSFHKGNTNNVWTIEDGGMTLEVGSTVKYAGYVNDGHWTNTKGVEKRFVPGHWNGDRFTYDPSAKGGMVLKQKWVEGKHYFDSAVRIMEKMFPDLLEAKLQKWLDDYFG